MTAQISDTFIYKRRRYGIAGVSGVGLFDPAEYGIRTQPYSTALWRGFRVTYGLFRGKMVLRELDLYHEGETPDIFGVSPVDTGYPLPGRSFFRKLAWPVRFHGGLLLGADFIDELYVHMGFHSPWKYRMVRELVFEEGSLIEDHDRSAEMEQLRERMVKQPPGPAGSDFEQWEEWIRQCFSLDYERWDY